MTMGFSMTQLSIAVIVSVIGTLSLSIVVFTLFSGRRRKHQPGIEQLRLDIKRPDTDSSTGSGPIVWSRRLKRQPETREGKATATSQSWPSRPARAESPRKIADWPLGADSVNPVSPVSTQDSLDEIRPVQPQSAGPLTSNIIYGFVPSPLTPSPTSAMPAISLFPKIAEMPPDPLHRAMPPAVQ